ncbi:putative G-protein coupled receptor No9 [Exaiptasia diaphana]|nr:putative G-protein coupled receptor No9 [Exaiptasia diaphana]
MSNSSKAYYEQCLFLGISTDFIVDYRSLYMSMVVINALIALPTMFGNLVIILGIWITPSLQTVSNLLLIGLACSDLGVGLIVPPLNIARNLLKLQNKSWCEVQVAYTFFGVMFCGVSFLTVAAFTIDKYLALHWHLRYVAIVTTRRVVYILFTILFTQLSFYASDTPIDGNNHTRLYLAVDITETVVIVNSFANPIIYCWRMREIRHAAKRIVMSLRFGTIVHPINESGTFTGTA